MRISAAATPIRIDKGTWPTTSFIRFPPAATVCRNPRSGPASVAAWLGCCGSVARLARDEHVAVLAVTDDEHRRAGGDGGAVLALGDQIEAAPLALHADLADAALGDGDHDLAAGADDVGLAHA